MDDPGNVAAQGEKNIQPELQAEADLQEDANRWQEDCEQDAYDIHEGLVGLTDFYATTTQEVAEGS